MRVLEARFHGGKKGDRAAPTLVGRVIQRGRKVFVEAALSLDGTPANLDAAAALAKLRFLVEQCAADPFEQLLALHSDYWSFVEVDARAGNQGAG